MKNTETIRKLRECAKVLLDVARELQSSERMEPPKTLEIVERLIRAKDGKAHDFCLPFVVGVDEFGDDVVLELSRLPHVLIGGATGQGKTMCLYSLIAGLVATKTPDEVRFVVYDPKCVEYTGLADLPHLNIPPVTSVEKMVEAIHWLESEVDNRLRMFARVKCRNISQFNSREQEYENAETLPKTVPYIVAVLDDITDLMQNAGKDVEQTLCRITAISRAAGVHLVMATVRPDAKVVTNAIKANVPGRIAFMTASDTDSKLLIKDSGAENLLGNGDFLLREGFRGSVRGQGAFVSDGEINALVDSTAKKFGKMTGGLRSETTPSQAAPTPPATRSG